MTSCGLVSEALFLCCMCTENCVSKTVWCRPASVLCCPVWLCALLFKIMRCSFVPCSVLHLNVPRGLLKVLLNAKPNFDHLLIYLCTRQPMPYSSPDKTLYIVILCAPFTLLLLLALMERDHPVDHPSTLQSSGIIQLATHFHKATQYVLVYLHSFIIRPLQSCQPWTLKMRGQHYYPHYIYHHSIMANL